MGHKKTIADKIKPIFSFFNIKKFSGFSSLKLYSTPAKQKQLNNSLNNIFGTKSKTQTLLFGDKYDYFEEAMESLKKRRN